MRLYRSFIIFFKLRQYLGRGEGNHMFKKGEKKKDLSFIKDEFEQMIEQFLRENGVIM